MEPIYYCHFYLVNRLIATNNKTKKDPFYEMNIHNPNNFLEFMFDFLNISFSYTCLSIIIIVPLSTFIFLVFYLIL
uniref:Uncharacterized protein n=1 Tax=Heterorhabditis bacteriophora TaxID=37862 RepID=A0A1I7WJT9_HETBA